MDDQKNCARNFKNGQYAFSNILKMDEKKKYARNFKVRKYAFFNI